MWSIYEIIHICTAVVDGNEEWSSQFKQLERGSLNKKNQGFNVEALIFLDFFFPAA